MLGFSRRGRVNFSKGYIYVVGQMLLVKFILPLLAGKIYSWFKFDTPLCVKQ